MIPASLTGSTSRRQSSPRWPMTAGARDVLAREVERLAAEVGRLAFARHDDAPENGGDVIEPTLATALRRLERLRGVLSAAVIVNDPGRPAIGRRVTVRESDGVRTYGLAAPGEGDPARGIVSIDSPLGAALTERGPGQVVDVVAPSGARRVEIVAIS